MKTIIALTLLCSCLVAGAQTPIPAPDGQTFPQTVVQYFTSHNTNLHTFDTDKLEVNIGADYVNNINTASSLGVQYLPKRWLLVESITKNAGIAGTILSQQAGAGVTVNYYDVRLSAILDLGYDFSFRRGFAEPRFEAKKAATDNTFFGVSIGPKIFFDQRKSESISPTFTVFTGFKLF